MGRTPDNTIGRNPGKKINLGGITELRITPLAQDGKRCSDGRDPDTTIPDLPNVRRKAPETYAQRPAWAGATAGDGLVLWAASPAGTPPERIIRIANKASRDQGHLLVTHTDDSGKDCGLLVAAANPQLRDGFRLTDRAAQEYVDTMKEMAEKGEIRLESHVVTGPHNELAQVDVYSDNRTVVSDDSIFRRDMKPRHQALTDLAEFALQEGLEVDLAEMHAIAVVHDTTVSHVVMGGKPGFAVNIKPDGEADVIYLGEISRRR